jgi:uncharacterized membrane protein YkoI
MIKTLLMTCLLALCFTFGMNLQLTHAEVAQQKDISMEKAKQIALQQVKGEIVSATEETDEGIYKYEIIIKAKDGKYEVEIDKTTGKVLEVEKEGPGHDDDGGYDD